MGSGSLKILFTCAAILVLLPAISSTSQAPPPSESDVRNYCSTNPDRNWTVEYATTPYLNISLEGKKVNTVDCSSIENYNISSTREISRDYSRHNSTGIAVVLFLLSPVLPLSILAYSLYSLSNKTAPLKAAGFSFLPMLAIVLAEVITELVQGWPFLIVSGVLLTTALAAGPIYLYRRHQKRELLLLETLYFTALISQYLFLIAIFTRATMGVY